MGGEGEGWIEPYAQYFGGFIHGQGKIFELDLGVGREVLVPWSMTSLVPLVLEHEDSIPFLRKLFQCMHVRLTNDLNAKLIVFVRETHHFNTFVEYFYKLFSPHKFVFKRLVPHSFRSGSRFFYPG